MSVPPHALQPSEASICLRFFHPRGIEEEPFFKSHLAELVTLQWNIDIPVRWTSLQPEIGQGVNRLLFLSLLKKPQVFKMPTCKDCISGTGNQVQDCETVIYGRLSG